MLQRFHEASQELHSVLPPHANKRDIRHPKEKIMTYSYESLSDSPESQEYLREGIGNASQIGEERTGVTHLVHAWHQQGHPVCVFIFFKVVITKHLVI